MALKKSELRAIIKNEDSTTEEKLAELLDLFHGELDGVKDERDAIQTQLDEAVEKIKGFETTDGEWKTKYEKEHSDFEAFKAEQGAKDTLKSKTEAYTELLKKSGIGEKYIPLIIKGVDLASIELEDGKIKGAEDLGKSLKEEYKDFVISSSSEGAGSDNPPPAGGDGERDLENLSMEEYIKARSK